MINYENEIENLIDRLAQLGFDSEKLWEDVANYRDNEEEKIERKYDTLNNYLMVQDAMDGVSKEETEENLEAFDEIKSKQLKDLDRKVFWYLIERYKKELR